jgi:para-nitrobenzyl esterase
VKLGVSAGGTHVNNLMASPGAKELFHAAIAQSAANGMTISRSMAVAEAAGVELAEERGDGTIKSLRAMPWQKLVENDAKYRRQSSAMVDGMVLTDHVAEVFSKGQQNDVPYIAGYNSFEGSLAAVIPIPAIEKAMQENIASVSEAYALPADDKNLPLLFYGDILFGAATLHLINTMKNVKSPAWTYYMDHVMDELRDKVRGTLHGGEVSYVFDRMNVIKLNDQLSRRYGVPAGTYTPTDEDLKTASTIHQFWVEFAKKGNPNANGLPDWPQYTSSDTATLVITNAGFESERDHRKKPLDLIESSFKERRQSMR